MRRFEPKWDQNDQLPITAHAFKTWFKFFLQVLWNEGYAVSTFGLTFDQLSLGKIDCCEVFSFNMKALVSIFFSLRKIHRANTISLVSCVKMMFSSFIHTSPSLMFSEACFYMFLFRFYLLLFKFFGRGTYHFPNVCFEKLLPTFKFLNSQWSLSSFQKFE